MVGETNHDSKIVADILRLLRSYNLTYRHASSVLQSAQGRLQQMMNEELAHMHLADGIRDDLNPDYLVLHSKRLNLHSSKDD
jgi:hypothetical protein